MKETLFNTQIALFFQKTLIAPEELWDPLKKNMGNIFEGVTPIIVPVPAEISLNEVPILQISSKDNKYFCQVARTRCDFFINGQSEQLFLNVKEDFLEAGEKFFSLASEEAKIRRVGFITRFFFENTNSNKVIAKLVKDDFKKLHEGDVYDAFVRYVSRITLGDLLLNHYTDITQFTRDNKEGFLITRDFNTPQSENYSITIEQLKSIIGFGEKNFKLKEILECMKNGSI